MLSFWVLLLTGYLRLCWGGPFSNFRQNENRGPIVNTTLGAVAGWEGTTRGGRVYQAWTKIPYAQPPTGARRFKPPEPVRKWNGTLDATGDIPMCIQINGGVEDCLYLNVFRPQVRIGKLPILVYIHGGSFQAGDVGPRESAEYLMDENVILVQISYRLNGFGFMTLGDEVMPGNFGMKDQTTGLKWVKENIEAFGGNPERITVFGGSAGGASTHLLLKSPLSENFVSQAVSHSGSINHVWSLLKPEFTTKCTMEVVEATGCIRESNQEILACLQAVNASDLLAAIVTAQNKNGPRVPFVPVIEPKTVEGAFATEDLSALPSTKPWITSTSNGEFLLFMGMAAVLPKQLFEFLATNIRFYLKDWIGLYINDPQIKNEGAELLSKLYYNSYNSTDEFILEFSKMHMDDSFIYPAVVNVLRHKGPKWLMRMEYKGELSSRNQATGEQYPGNVAGHDDEKFYYMNYRSQYRHLGPEQTPADYEVSKRLIRYLVNFAYYGDPTPPGVPTKWPQFTSGEMLTVTANGDKISTPDSFGKFKNVLNTWSYYMGWKSN